MCTALNATVTKEKADNQLVIQALNASNAAGKSALCILPSALCTQAMFQLQVVMHAGCFDLLPCEL